VKVVLHNTQLIVQRKRLDVDKPRNRAQWTGALPSCEKARNHEMPELGSGYLRLRCAQVSRDSLLNKEIISPPIIERSHSLDIFVFDLPNNLQ
jgi:hypothetical protein